MSATGFRVSLIGPVFICLAMLVSGCSDETPQQAAPPPPSVIVTEIENTPVGEHKEFVARTEAVEEVDLRARVEGYLTHRGFVEGETVHKGQLLFELDPASFEAALSSAEAELSRNRAAETKAIHDLKRGKELQPKGYISQSDLDKLSSDFDQAKASVAAAEAAVETARINLGYTRITAPFAGVIGKERYSIGNLVNASSEPLARLSSVDPMYVNFQINEKELVNYHLEEGERDQKKSKEFNLNLRLPNGAAYKQKGTFNFADTKVDETTGTVNLRAEFPNPDGILFPGMYVTLIAESQDKTPSPLIPQAAVQENQQGRFVLVVEADNKVSTRFLELGRRIGPMWVVKGGLKSGERIIVEGLQKVQSGGTVTPVERKVDPVTGAIIPPEEASEKKPDTNNSSDTPPDNSPKPANESANG
ncbi:efflux RND transporter periplasmic adaptor subunit [Spongorhabdus nitratireducens]